MTKTKYIRDIVDNYYVIDTETTGLSLTMMNLLEMTCIS